jgi:hypothetical protein
VAPLGDVFLISCVPVNSVFIPVSMVTVSDMFLSLSKSSVVGLLLLL